MKFFAKCMVFLLLLNGLFLSIDQFIPNKKDIQSQQVRTLRSLCSLVVFASVGIITAILSTKEKEDKKNKQPTTPGGGATF